MRGNLIIGWLLIIVQIVLNSCKKSPSPGPPPIYYAFSSDDLSKIPYTGKETLRFIYRNGSKLDTFIFRPASTLLDTIYGGDKLIDDSHFQEYYEQHKKFIFDCKQGQGSPRRITLNFTATAGSANFTLNYDSFYIEATLFGLTNPHNGHFHDSIIFEGMTFHVAKDIEFGSGPPYYTIYYTAYDGIIRMEYKNGTSLTLLP